MVDTVGRTSTYQWDGYVFTNVRSSHDIDFNALGFEVADALVIRPLILEQPKGGTVPPGQTLQLSVKAAGSPYPTSYQWYAGQPGDTSQPVFSGANTYTPPAPSSTASYWVRLTSDTGSVDSQVATIRVFSGSFPGAYFGSIAGSSGRWAMHVRPDNTAVFIAHLPEHATVVLAQLSIGADGAFSTNASEFRAATSAASPIVNDIALSGSISASGVTGQLAGAGTFTGAPAEETGAAAAIAGLYSAPAIDTAQGAVHAIIGADGQALLIMIGPAQVDGGAGSANATGELTIAMTQTSQVSAHVDSSSRLLHASMATASGAPVTFAGAADSVVPLRRLVNLSARGFTGTNDLVMIAGFAIGGNTPKELLLRVSGPALAEFGVTGTLPKPLLEVYRGSTKLRENRGWDASGDGDAVRDAGIKVGAFPLTPGSSDAALLLTLDPGGYTAIASDRDGGTGEGLLEIYEMDSTPNAPTLVNISTRGRARNGGGELIAGFVVTGNAPKKVLVRAIGPSLETLFGLSGALADPVLTLFRDTTEPARNDDWATAGDLEAVTAAFKATGAFELPLGSKDAVLLLSLPPGGYTAQASGADDASGVALVEVYELP